MASPAAILSILIRGNPDADADAGLAKVNQALDAATTQVPEDLVERGARTFDRSLLAQQDEATKRNHARAVLRAASEAGWVSKDDCDFTHEADMAYIRDADAARDEARAQVEQLRAELDHYRMDGNRQFQAARDARAQAEAAMAECVDLVEKLAQVRNDNNTVCDERDEARRQSEALAEALEGFCGDQWAAPLRRKKGRALLRAVREQFGGDATER